MFKLLSNIFGLLIVATCVLTLIRFAGPACYACRVSGKGAKARTVCLGLVEFRGDDFFSIYRLRPAVGIK